MPAAIHLSALAYAIGAVVLATIAGRSWLAWATACAGFLAALLAPEIALKAAGSGAVALGLTALAVARLAGWHSTLAFGLATGVLAGSWAVLLEAQGAPTWAAVLAALAALTVAVVQSRRPSFAPPRLCEDALVVVAIVGVCAAAGPGLTDGWRAAVNLKFGGATQAASAVPAWAIAVTLAAAAAGAGYGAWSRR